MQLTQPGHLSDLLLLKMDFLPGNCDWHLQAERGAVATPPVMLQPLAEAPAADGATQVRRPMCGCGTPEQFACCRTRSKKGDPCH
jgi:hypothetical protein